MNNLNQNQNQFQMIDTELINLKDQSSYFENRNHQLIESLQNSEQIIQELRNELAEKVEFFQKRENQEINNL